MTQSEALNILTKISEHRASQDEMNSLAREIANGNFERTKNEDEKGNWRDTEAFDVNHLKQYTKQLDEVEKRLENLLKVGEKNYVYGEQEVETIKKLIKERNELNKKINETLTNERLIVEIESDINVEYELQNRALNKQLELKQLEVKQLREGLTLQEKTTKSLTEWAEKNGINTDKLKTGFGEVKNAVNGFGKVLKETLEPWAKVDQAAAQYTRTIGGSAASMRELRKNTLEFMNARGIGVKYNTSMEELIKLQADYNKSIGRSITLTNDQKESFAAMKAVAGEQTAIEFTTKLENFGLNPDEAGKRMGEMFSKASKSGVAFEKYSKNFLDNIKLAQNYNFTNGLRGLDAMARKATEVKLNMQQVASFADKVSTLEGAMSTGANLSVLGGSFARFGNPLQMMYEGLNDMEGLQDRVINMFGNLGKWDYSKGQVDVSVFNKQRIKAAAQAMGMDYGQVMEMVNANARRNIVEGQLGSLQSGVRGDEEMKNLILNKAQLDEQGQAYVTIGDEKKYLNEINASDRAALKRENNSDSDNIKEIATNTRGFRDLMEGLDKQKDSILANGIEKSGIGEGLKSIISTVSQNRTVMDILAWMPKFAQIFASFAMMGNGVGNIFGSRGGGGIPTAFGKAANGPKVRTFKNGTQMVWNGKRVGKGGKWVNASSKAGQKIMNSAGGAGRFSGLGRAALGIGGAAASIGGMVADQYLENSNFGQNKGQNVGWYTAAKASTRAAEFAGIGAMFGPWGALAGGLIGAGFGAYQGYQSSKKNQLVELIRKQHGLNINPDNYDIDELQRIAQGVSSIQGTALKAKMISNGDIMQGFAKGGYTGNGSALDPAGIVHKGEYVMNASDVDAIKNGNVLKPLGNMMNQLHVAKNNVPSNTQGSSFGSGSLDLNINIGGKIDLEANGTAKSISGSDILTNDIIDSIIRKIQERTDYALNKDKTHIKFM